MQTVPSTAEAFVAQGNDAMRRKDWPEAARIWALMREKFPDHPRGYTGGAAALKESRDFAAADAVALEGLKKFPKEADLYVEYGNIAWNQRDWPEAAKRWALMREKLPEHPRGYHSGAAALKENRDFAAAEALVLEGLEKFPKEPALYIEYGNIAWNQRDWPAAIERWALMREKLPEHPRGYSSGAAALKESRDYSAAEALALEGLEKFPKEPGLYIEYANVAWHQRDWLEAAKRWALMREKLPENPRGYHSGVAALKEQGDYAAADAFVLQSLERFPKEPGLYLEYGAIAMRQRDWSEADKRWALMREKLPEHPRGYIGEIIVLKEQEEFDAADAIFHEHLAKFPEEPGLYIEYIDIARRFARNREKLPEYPHRYLTGREFMKDLDDDELASLALAVVEEPENEPAGLYLSQAHQVRCRKNWAEMARRCALMREKCPQHPSGYRGGGEALKRQKDYAAADALLLEGMELFPDDAGMYLEYADVAVLQHNWIEAVRRWALMREKCPNHPRGYTGGAAALTEQGRFAEAKDVLQQGLERLPLEPSLYAECNKMGLHNKAWSPRKFGPKWEQWLERQSKNIEEPYWLVNSQRPTVDELTEFLLEYDVISFDIFDTALFRAVNLPQDVFSIMAAEMQRNDFWNVRQAAERLARYHKEFSASTREVTLEEIYARLVSDYGIDLHWKDREIELELALSVENPYIKSVYENLLASGKTLVFMTDMYLPRPIIEQLLSKAAYQKYDDILISNERGLSKSEGTLQLQLIERYTGKEIIHIGDNFNADIKKTRLSGMDAFHYIDQRRLKSAYKCRNADLGSSFYRAIINNTMNNGIPMGKSLHYEHGYRVGGIIVAGYCSFINEVARKNNCDKILFFSRDCEIIHRIYNELYHEFDNEYANVSRRALRKLIDDYAYSVINQVISFVYKRYDFTIEQILHTTDLGFLIEELEYYGIEKKSFPNNVEKEKITYFLYSEIGKIRNRFKIQTNAAMKYFSDLIGNSRNVALVDLGWSGFIQSCFIKFCKDKVNSDLNFYSILLASRNSSDAIIATNNNSLKCYIYSHSKNNDISRIAGASSTIKLSSDQNDIIIMSLENFFTSEEAQLNDYIFDEYGEVVFQRAKYSYDSETIQDIRSIQAGMIDFCRVFKRYSSPCQISIPISPYLVTCPMLEATMQPAYNKKIFGNFLDDTEGYSIDHGGSDIKKMGELFEKFQYIEDAPKESLSSQQIGKRVLIVAHEMNYTGPPRSTLRIANIAKKAGYDIEVWSAKPGPFMREFEDRNIAIQVIDQNILTEKITIDKIASFDIAICNSIMTDDYVRTISNLTKCIWYIREATNLPFFLKNNQARLKTLQLNNCVRVSVSEYSANAIRQFTSAPVIVVNNAVEDDAYLALPHIFAKDDKIKIMQIGTIEERKGSDLFINAYKTLPEKYKSRIELYFAGRFLRLSTTFCAYLFSEIENEPNIHFLGEIRDKNEKIRIMSQMDIIVVASRDDAAPLVSLEAAMLSKPLIVTENVGTKYMVTEENGLIIKSGSVSALRSAFMEFVDKSDQLEKMGRASRRIYEEKASMAVHQKNIVELIEYALHTTITPSPSRQKTVTAMPLKSKSDKKIVVSLTSHPLRIKHVAQCVVSLLRQRKRADRVVLWLAKEEFPHGNDELPKELLRLSDHGLEIAWCDEDLKPHKKYYYVMREEPDAVIITVDDDATYSDELIGILSSCHQEHPHSVIATRTNQMLFTPDGEFRKYGSWLLNYQEFRNIPLYSLVPAGPGGVLYPPHAVPSIAFDQKAIMKTSLYCDDLWLKIMVTLNGYPTVLTLTNSRYSIIDGTQQPSLYKNNIYHNNMYDAVLASILQHVESNYDLRRQLMKRLRGVGDEGEWIVPETISYETLLSF